MSELPPGWRRERLGGVCQIVSGSTPKTGVAEYWGGDIPWLTPDDLAKNRAMFVDGGRRSLTQAGYDSCSTRLVPKGSVLYSSRAPIGYAAIATRPVCTNQGFKTAIPGADLEPRFLYWQLQASTESICARASGTTFKEISGKAFAATEVVVPPLDEQHRIVTVLEDHLSRLDAAAAYLTAASKRSPGLMPPLPDRASEVRLRELITGLRYGTSTRCSHDGPGWPVLRIPNVARGHIDTCDLKQAVALDVDLGPYELDEGDLLVVRSNGSLGLVGRMAAVPPDFPSQTAFASYLIRIRLDRSRVRPAWVQHMSTLPTLRRQVEGAAASSAGQHNLNKAGIEELTVPLPSLQDQDAWLAATGELEKAGNRLADAVHRLTQRQAQSRRSLTSAAFRGLL